MPNEEGIAAIKLLARLEGILLDPVYTGKAMAGLLDGIEQQNSATKGQFYLSTLAGHLRCLLIIAGVA